MAELQLLSAHAVLLVRVSRPSSLVGMQCRRLLHGDRVRTRGPERRGFHLGNARSELRILLTQFTDQFFRAPEFCATVAARVPRGDPQARHPNVKFRGDSDYNVSRKSRASNRQAQLAFPPLHRAHSLAEIRGDFFP